MTTTARFTAFVLAASVTLAMLSGIGALADGQVAHAQLAATTSAATAAPRA